MLTARGLSFRLPSGDRVLFRDVSFEVNAGDAVAIEGPSGVGKTTLLALLAGLMRPTSGTVTVESISTPPFAWVLQTLNSLPGRSVLANACLYGLVDDLPAPVVRHRATDLLVELGMGDMLATPARQLSGGEQQRMAVARALASSRPIVLADEPTNQLDHDNARQVMRTLFAASHGQRTVVVVTHDHDALPAGTRVLRLTEQGLHQVA
jgi:putative ABC transport system ATP-binding protein/lipoprotein-releasing system ATP-binding protein